LLLSTGPCPRPENMTKGQLIKELHERGLSDAGTVQQRIERIRNDDRRKIKTCLIKYFLSYYLPEYA
jgi:hypothetical protein